MTERNPEQPKIADLQVEQSRVGRLIKRRFLSLLGQMDFNDEGLNKGSERLLKDLTVPEILELVKYRNPVTFTNEHLVKRGVKKPSPLDRAMISFVMKVQSMREQVELTLGNIHALKIDLALDVAEEKPST